MTVTLSQSEAKQLLTLFEDQSDYWHQLSRGNEQECLALVDLLEKVRRKWATEEAENNRLRAVNNNYERDLVVKEEQNKELKAQLTDARAQIASLVAEKQDIQTERHELERQVDIVRDLLRSEPHTVAEETMRKYDFLQHKPPSRTNLRESAGSSEGHDSIDFDRTEESVEHLPPPTRQHRSRSDRGVENQRRGRKRRSKSVPKPTIPVIDEEDLDHESKRSKDDSEIRRESNPEPPVQEVQVTTTLGPPPHRGDTLNRSFSEPHLNQPYPPPPPYNKLTPTMSMKSMDNLRSPALQSWVSSSGLTSRHHLFLSKTVIKPDVCDYCNKRIAFGKQATRCQDCKYTSHPDCKSFAPLPCVPKNGGTPSTGSKHPIRLADLVPNSRPMIPHAVIHCVTEIERRGDFRQEGIYRLSGSKEEVDKLFERFMHGRGTPDLSMHSTDVLVGVMKKFFLGLKEPLIPHSSRQDFLRSVRDKNRMMLTVRELPVPNRDTMAYFLSHLQTVADYAELNKMPVKNLTKALSPSLVGFAAEPLTSFQQAGQEAVEMEQILSSLLQLPKQFWTNLLDLGQQPLLASSATPKLRPRGNWFTHGLHFGTPSKTKHATPGSSKRSQKRYFEPPPWK